MPDAFRFGLAVVSCATSIASAQSFPSQGIDLLSHLPLSAFTPTPGNGNSCWGWVSPGGREYAIMGLSNQVAFVDITNPATPVIRASVPHSNSLWADIKVYQQYCYVSNESGGGVQVINMAGLDSGTATLVTSITAGGLSTAHTLAVDETSGFLYVCGANLNNGAVIAYSLANPAAPVEVGRWTGPYTHEAHVVTYTSGPNMGRQICFAFCGGSGLRVLDVTNKAAITQIGSSNYPGLNYCHQGWTDATRTYLYVNDEIDGPAQGVPYDLTRVFNVTNLNSPTLAGTFSAGVPGAIDHNNYVHGRYIYQSNYTSGLRVLDLNTSPISPVEVAWIDTHPSNDNPTYDGTWSNYPYFPSGTIIISDIQEGLLVVRLNLDYLTFNFVAEPPSTLPPSTPSVVTVDVSSTLTPVNPATVRLFSSINNAPFTSVVMAPVDSDTFTANLPPIPCLGTLRWYVSAQNTSGTTFVTPQGAPASFRSVFANPGANTLIFYDMETDAGWVGGQPGDTATTGMWERGDPDFTIAQPGDDHTDPPGVACWVTGRAAGTQAGSFDVDGGFTTLLSPTINLSSVHPNVRISYWRSYSNGLGGSPNNDIFRVQMSNNNGATWSPVETVGPTGTSPGWIEHDFRVADILPLTAQMRLRFIAEDAGAGSLVEALVDDLRVYSYTCPAGSSCDTIDFNNDGLFPDTGDIDDFLSVFGGGACSNDPNCNDIDFNNDGLFPDTQDIDSLLSVFGGGACL